MKERRFFALFLGLVLLLTLVGCAKKSGGAAESGWRPPNLPGETTDEPEFEQPTDVPDTEAPTEAPTYAPTEAPTEPALDLSHLVTDAYSYSEDYVDYSGSAASVDYHIPRIELDGLEIEALNRKIYDDWYSTIEYSREGIRSDGIPEMGTLDYDWCVNGDFLSLKLEAVWELYEGHGLNVYNVRISERRQASRDELLAARGFDRTRYETLVAQAQASALIDMVYDYQDSIFGEYASFEDYYRKTVAPENVATAEPYLNREGHLCILGHYYIPAGGGYPSVLIDLETFTLSPHYSEMTAGLTP